jgi:hypothetical protein
MAVHVLIRNKEGLICTDCCDGTTRYLTDEEYAVEMLRKQLRKAELKLEEKKRGN